MTKTINILMLGPTGVGKSTFVNGFVNYLTYKTLEDAEKGPDVSKIPTYFTLFDDNYTEMVVETGVTENEYHGVGASSTQLPMTHSFQFDDDTINIIDTPGVGDCRGIAQDRQHFLTIIRHLCRYDYINAICILLPPNSAKLDAMFEFCIQELLAHLHRNACNNILFCFTHTRGNFFLPGDTYPALKELLSKGKIDRRIKLNRQTMYCFDNESIRFLAAIRQGAVFSPRKKEEYARSWITSEEEMCRLLERIVSLTPHPVRDTRALNNAKRTINILMGPMLDMENDIVKQVESLKATLDEIQDCLKKGVEYTGQLFVPCTEVKYEILKHAKTVCVSKECLKVVSVDAEGNTKTIYPQTCHEPCSFWFKEVEPEQYPCEALKGCRAFREDYSLAYNECCTKCKCKWDQHMHVKYNVKTKYVRLKDENVQRLIDENKSDEEVLVAHAATLMQERVDLEEQLRIIRQISHKFVHFLSRTAISPCNDAMESYITYRISNANNAVARGANDMELQALERMLEVYRREKKEFEEVLATSPTAEERLLDPAEIARLEMELYSLRRYGLTFLNLKRDNDEIAAKADICKEVKYDPPVATQQSATGGRVSKLWQITKGLLKTVRNAAVSNILTGDVSVGLPLTDQIGDQHYEPNAVDALSADFLNIHHENDVF